VNTFLRDILNRNLRMIASNLLLFVTGYSKLAFFLYENMQNYRALSTQLFANCPVVNRAYSNTLQPSKEIL